MITNNSVISDVRSALRINHNDSELTSRAIYSKLLDVRNKLLKQQTDKRKLWESDNIFTPLNIQLEEVPIADYCNFKSLCTISRSKYKLPKIVDSGFFGLIAMPLSPIIGNRKFIETTANEYNKILALGLPGNNVYYWMFDNYLCLSSPTIDSVIWRVLLEDDDVDVRFTLDYEDYCEAANCPNNPLEQPFKCPGYLKEEVINITTQFFMQTYKHSLQDTTPDGMDTSK